ncbi:GatB/YqeY domain-containing protein [Rhodoblastus sp.]|uniref:GatB/YqeY domain-containing protein n=1 Tax=Rhodoblastus sp. TaxID=1962975 RepID=UPI003F9D93BB
MLREQFASELKLAMKAGEKRRVETIRMVVAALKDKDIEARTTGKEVGEEDILALLQKLTKSRQESAEIYENNARPELAAQEREEIAIIASFLPQPMSEAEVAAAIKAVIADTGAASIKDMGKVIAELKARHAGKMDFAKVSPQVKTALAG